MEDGELKAGKFAIWICLLAGAMDASTGALLVAVPRVALSLMGLEPQGEPLAYLQFIGAFVFAVGSLYLWGWYLLGRNRVREWRALWIATAWARTCVGVTVLGLMLSGRLAMAWASVPVADLGLAAIQYCYLRLAMKADD